MCEDVLDSVGKLERVNVTETELNVRIDDQLRQAENLTTQVEGVSETRLFPLLRRKSPERGCQ